jgi:RsmE family RNA methyltransferase
MRTLRVFYPKLTTKKQGNKIAVLDEQQVRHMHVLRVDSVDYKFEAVDGEGLKADLELVKLTKSDAVFRILSMESEVDKVTRQGVLIFPIIKQSNLENAISQVTQFNFYSHIVLYFSEFSRYSKKKYSDNKLKRLEKLVKAAFVQSQSVIKPIISLKQNLQEAIEFVEENSRADSQDLSYLIPDTEKKDEVADIREVMCGVEQINQNEKQASSNNSDISDSSSTADSSNTADNKNFVVIIGAEAGFSKGEYKVLSSIEVEETDQIKYIRLGNSILRSETAAVAITSIVS